MPAGSVMFFLGSVFHGGGANTTERQRLGVILEYVAGWLRTLANVRRVARGRMVGRAQAAPVTLSGAVTQASWTLRSGLYELYCSMPGHLARGMHVLVRVR